MRFFNCVVALALFAVFAHWLIASPTMPTVTESDPPFPLFWMLLKQSQPWAPTLQRIALVCVCITGMVASSLAFALAARPNPSLAVARLTRALLMGTLAVAWLWITREFPPASSWFREHQTIRLAIDIVACSLFLLAPIDLLRFAACFPRPVVLDAFWQVNRSHEFSPLLSILSRLMPKRVEKLRIDQEILGGRRGLEWALHALQSRTATITVILLAVVATLIWQHLSGKGFIGSLSLTIPMVVPIFPLILGFFVTKANARLGLLDDRRAVEWIYWSVMLATLLFGLSFVGSMAWILTGDAEGSMKGFFYTSLLGPILIALTLIVAIAMSVFYRGAVDPALMIRRTALYSVLGVALTTLFVAMEGVISSQVITRVGLPSETGAVVAGTAVALAFGPARNKVESRVLEWIERLRPAQDLSASERETMTIAFCDLSGFTSLTIRDENAALTAAASFHRTARNIAKLHRGRVVKTLGDAVLMCFKSATEAIAAVRALHADAAVAFSGAHLPAMPVHSGVHSGPVAVAADGDVFGATVNLAARLQSEAGSNEILLSNETQAAAQIIDALDSGERLLRSIPSPVRVWRISA